VPVPPKLPAPAPKRRRQRLSEKDAGQAGQELVTELSPPETLDTLETLETLEPREADLQEMQEQAQESRRDTAQTFVHEQREGSEEENAEQRPVVESSTQDLGLAAASFACHIQQPWMQEDVQSPQEHMGSSLRSLASCETQACAVRLEQAVPAEEIPF